MNDVAKDRFTQIIKTIATALIGGLITLLFSMARIQSDNTVRITRLEVLVEPLKTVAPDIAYLKATAERNVAMLTRIEGKVDEHISTTQNNKK